VRDEIRSIAESNSSRFGTALQGISTRAARSNSPAGKKPPQDQEGLINACQYLIYDIKLMFALSPPRAKSRRGKRTKGEMSRRWVTGGGLGYTHEDEEGRSLGGGEKTWNNLKQDICRADLGQRPSPPGGCIEGQKEEICYTKESITRPPKVKGKTWKQGGDCPLLVFKGLGEKATGQEQIEICVPLSGEVKGSCSSAGQETGAELPLALSDLRNQPGGARRRYSYLVKEGLLDDQKKTMWEGEQRH